MKRYKLFWTEKHEAIVTAENETEAWSMVYDKSDKDHYATLVNTVHEVPDVIETFCDYHSIERDDDGLCPKCQTEPGQGDGDND